MNKFKFLTLSLVCVTVAFGYNDSANATNTVLINKINPNENDIKDLSAENLAHTLMYQILRCGICEYPGQRKNVLDYADIMKRMISEGMMYDTENGQFVWDGKYNYSIPLSYEEQKKLLDQAALFFHQILMMAEDNLKYNNGADKNTYETLVKNIVKELTKISRNEMNECLM